MGYKRFDCITVCTLVDIAHTCTQHSYLHLTSQRGNVVIHFLEPRHVAVVGQNIRVRSRTFSRFEIPAKGKKS